MWLTFGGERGVRVARVCGVDQTKGGPGLIANFRFVIFGGQTFGAHCPGSRSRYREPRTIKTLPLFCTPPRKLSTFYTMSAAHGSSPVTLVKVRPFVEETDLEMYHYNNWVKKVIVSLFSTVLRLIFLT